MPSIQNPFSLAKSDNFLNAVKGALFQYAGQILRNEGAIVSPSAGYKAYDKRMAFAAKVVANPNLYAEQAAAAVALLSSAIELDEQATFIRLYSDWLGYSVFVCKGDVADTSKGDTYGGTLTIFDSLAGVNLGDLA